MRQCNCGLYPISEDLDDIHVEGRIHTKCPGVGCGATSDFTVGKTKGAYHQVGGDHYKFPIQPWDYIIANKIPFLEGNAIAYISRHARKGGRQDLEKAIHYLQKAIETYYPEKT